MNNFRVGQRVVCVRDDWIDINGVLGDGPRVGRVCTVIGYDIPIIEELEASDWANFLLLEGFSRLYPGDMRPRGYCAHFFRPAVEKPCDISVFTRLLTPTKEFV